METKLSQELNPTHIWQGAIKENTSWMQRFTEVESLTPKLSSAKR
jgi:hypothetical protein